VNFEVYSNFCRVSALVNCCRVLLKLQIFTPINRGVKETLQLASTSKESLLKLDNHQWSFAWFGNCPRREQFQILSL